MNLFYRVINSVIFQCRILLFCVLGCFSIARAEHELIKDPRFRSGFILWEPAPGKHIRYGELKGLDSSSTPIWGLSQWSSKSPLNPAAAVRSEGLLICSNSAKGITIREGSWFSMFVNSAVEYGGHARTAQEPWVHLLVEQEFESPAALSKLTSAVLNVEARLVHSRSLHHGDYSPDVHAAQFQIFFTIQNRRRGSKGFGDLLWFGIPIYDNRHRFPAEFKARDFGGTSKFIFTPGGRVFTSDSAQDGGIVRIHKDLLPLFKESLQTAWERGFLKDSKDIADYYIGGMNMGWEVPGLFDVDLQVRNLSLMLQPKPGVEQR
ncbi:MAG TPA: hypothetical protein VMZ27_06680 [Candidatus Saccharimonadales bacterium]|nr:hypothetical protein [Candidatus Saccharimonadales bacterium]